MLLHNPSAGRAAPVIDEVIAVLRANRCTVCPIHAKQKRERLAACLHDHDGDLLMIAGGDGTVGRVLRAISHVRAPIVILPLGTANNVASALGLPDDPLAWAIESLTARDLQVRVATVDGPFGSQRCLEAAGIGALADALAGVKATKLASDRKTAAGRQALRQALTHAEPLRVAVELDGTRDDEELLLAEVLRIPCIGPRLCLAAHTHPSDAHLTLVTVGREERGGFATWLEGPDDGTAAPVRVRCARTVGLEWQGRHAHVDDRFHAPRAGPQVMRVSLEPRALRIRVPNVPRRARGEDIRE